jgi:hypothetical protein
MNIDLNNIFDIKKIMSICVLMVVITICSIALSATGTSIDFLGVKITKTQLVDATVQSNVRAMMEDK